jgi:hypothetical protein
VLESNLKWNIFDNESETILGAPKKCSVCNNESETTRCLHCNKMVCLACKDSHTGMSVQSYFHKQNIIQAKLSGLACVG